MSSMMHQMRVGGFDGAKISGVLSFKCRASAEDREEQLMRFAYDVNGWLVDHLGDVGIEVVDRDAVRHGEEFELVVKLKVTP